MELGLILFHEEMLLTPVLDLGVRNPHKREALNDYVELVPSLPKVHDHLTRLKFFKPYHVGYLLNDCLRDRPVFEKLQVFDQVDHMRNLFLSPFRGGASQDLDQGIDLVAASHVLYRTCIQLFFQL